MKKLLLSLAALCATTFAVAQTQLLNNPGFEDWNSDSEPAYWKTASTAGNATLSKSEDARSGAYAVQINNQSSNKRIGYQETTLTPGTYVFSFYAMGVSEGASVRPGYTTVTDGVANSNYQYGSYTNDISATDWQLVTHEFTLTDTTTLCLVIMNPKNTASVLIDDASLTTTNGGLVENNESDDNNESGDNSESGDNNEGNDDTEVVSIANTPETAYTPEQAIAIIDAGKDLSTAVYVKGIITSIKEVSTSYGNATYFISADGTESNVLEIFRGYYYNGDKFTAEDQLKVGDEVIVYGKLVNYNGTKEMTTGSSIYSIGGITSGIASIAASTEAEAIYTLDGQKVQNVQKGKIYIQNGKKFLAQ
jgi:hypothetical protein